MSNDAVEQAIQLIKDGKTEQGGIILVELLRQDPKLERAWAWLYACVRTDEQRIYCLEKVLEINPNHARAKAALEKLSTQQEPGPGKKEKITSKILKKNLLLKKGRTHDHTVTFEPAEIKPPIIPPKIIIVKPDENPYTEPKFVASDFASVDSGMPGTRLSIQGITITPRDHPRCIDSGYPLSKKYCDVCEFFSYLDCPLSNDPDILVEVKTLFAQNKRRWVEYYEHRETVVDAIYLELKEHGRPLHYHMLAKIIKERYPELKLNARRILHYMMWHPDKFVWVDIGVYRAK